MKHQVISAYTLEFNSEQFAQLSAEILRAGHALRFRATGGSMHPLVREGDRVLVRPLPASAVKPGEVVLAQTEAGRAVMHRVVRVHQGSFTLQGDQAHTPDGTFPESMILGRLESLQRNGADIRLEGFRMRLLGRLVAWNARNHFNRYNFKNSMIKYIKRFPGLRRFFNTEVPLEQ